MNIELELWKFGRARLAAAIEGMTEAQAAWRPYPGAHSVVEILYHLAGAEHFWWFRLTGANENDPHYDARIDAAVMDGFLREGACPFSGDELTLASATRCLEKTAELISPVLSTRDEKQRGVRLVSPIGDEVSGEEGIVRLCSHAPYHVGQIWMIKMHPDFPN